MTECLFVTSLGVLVYAYIGYPLLLFVLSRLLGRSVNTGVVSGSVAVVLSVHNGEDCIQEKLHDLQSQDPGIEIHYCIGLDGCTDNTASKIPSGDKIRVFEFPERLGKAEVLNRIVQELTDDFIVFTDVRQCFQDGAIQALLQNFADPSIGAVSGKYTMTQTTTGDMKGVSAYWKFETFLRQCESRLFSSVGATGAIYAIRREAWSAIPTDSLIDDVSIPLRINATGLRTVFEPKAIANDSFSESWDRERIRKTRTMAGNFQIALKPWSYGNPYQCKLLFQYLSHKWLRLWIPLVLIVVFITNIILMMQNQETFTWLSSNFVSAMFGLQVLSYSLGFIALRIDEQRRNNIFLSIPGTFLLMNISVLIGCYNFITRKYSSGWD